MKEFIAGLAIGICMVLISGTLIAMAIRLCKSNTAYVIKCKDMLDPGEKIMKFTGLFATLNAMMYIDDNLSDLDDEFIYGVSK